MVIQYNHNTHHQAVCQTKELVHPYKLLVCQLDVSPFVLQPFIEASVLYCHSAVAQAIFQVVNSREVSQTSFCNIYFNVLFLQSLLNKYSLKR